MVKLCTATATVVVLLGLFTGAEAFSPHHRATRLKEREHREQSDLHKHAPVLTRWRDHEYEDEWETVWPQAENVTEEIFSQLVLKVAQMHRESSKGTPAEPRAVHLDEVFQAFDADNDGHVHVGPEEHHNPDALYLANMWLAQAEIVEQHEKDFHVRDPEHEEMQEREHAKRYHAFDHYSTLRTLEEYTDSNRDGEWSMQELGDALDYIHRHHHSIGRSTLRSMNNMYRTLDLNRDGVLDKDEVLKTRRVDEMEEFIEQEALRLAVHEMEERDGYAIDKHRYHHFNIMGRVDASEL